MVGVCALKISCLHAGGDQKSRYTIDESCSVSSDFSLYIYTLFSSYFEYVAQEIFEELCSKMIYLPFKKMDTDCSHFAAGTARRHIMI